MSSYIAKLAAPDDPLNAARLYQAIANEVDEARQEFIKLMREAQAEAEVEAEVVRGPETDDIAYIDDNGDAVYEDEDLDDDPRGWPEEALQ